jgi:phosphate transport system substrate-binding protein
MKKVVKMLMVFFSLFMMTLHCNAQDMLQIRGSDTMLNVVQELVEVYMEKNPGQAIALTGGGSGTGIAGLRNRTVDIANSSRDLHGRETIELKSKNVEPNPIVIGVDCISIIVNTNNKVNKLTTQQLGAIFRGDIKNWKDVGGDDMPITLYGRQSTSGTFYEFRKRILKGDYAYEMRHMNGSSQIVESIKEDVSGIGYVGRGFVTNNPQVNVVSVATDTSGEYINPVDLTDMDAHTYPMYRTLIQFVDGKPHGAIKDFILFELSEEGQKIIEDMGFFKVSADEEIMKQNKQVLG